MIDRHIQADGSANEGVGYWSNSFRATMPALVALPRYRGKALREMLHPKLHRIWTHVGALTSTAGEPGSYLPIADTVGNRMAFDAIGKMAFALGGEWSGLLGACLEQGRGLHMDWTSDGSFAIIHGPDAAPKPQINVPVFARLTRAGMVSSNRPWHASACGGGIRLFLVGAMANAGHAHRDKGSFILEVDGETYAAGRGMTRYEDTEHVPFLKSEEAHNLAVPEGCNQRETPRRSSRNGLRTGTQWSCAPGWIRAGRGWSP